jgi:cytochrome c oxidase subunit 4
MAHSTSPTHGANAKHGSVHVVSLKLLLGIGVALLILTYLTVAATYVDLGYKANLALALAIAVVKAALVMLFFMHLLWDNPFNALWAIIALLFIAIFIVAAISDSSQYQTNYAAPGQGALMPK